MDYTDKYELDVKAGNRLGRRLRASLGRIGNAARTIGQRTEAFDPNAYDGDGDGVIQDGSQWERPSVARGQIPTQAFSQTPEVATGDTGQDLAEQVDRDLAPRGTNEGGVQEGMSPYHTDDEEAVTDKRRLSEQAALSDELPLDVEEPLPQPRTSPKNPRTRDGFERMTPRALAEHAVPDNFEDMLSRSVDSIVGHPSQYASRADYDLAREIVEARLRSHTEKSIAHHNKMKELYDAKHGAGSFDRDLVEDRALLRKRMIEVIGSSSAQHLFTTDRPDGLAPFIPDVAPDDFIREIAQDPDAPIAVREFYQKLIDSYDNIPANDKRHLLWAHKDITGQPNVPKASMFFRIIGDLVAGTQSGNAAYRLRGEEHTLDTRPSMPQFGSSVFDGMSGADIAKRIMKDYWAWAEKQPSAVRLDVKRDGTVDGLPTDEQIEARIDMATLAPNVGKALPFLFPGSVAAQGLPTGGYALTPTGYMTPETVFENVTPSFLPNDVQKMRNIIETMLKENPAVLRQWQRFGVPTIQFLHPLSSPLASYVQAAIPASAVGKKDNRTSRLFERFSNLARRVPFGSYSRASRNDLNQLHGVRRPYTKLENIIQSNDLKTALNWMDDVAVLMQNDSANTIGGFYQIHMGAIFVDPFTSDLALAEGNRVSQDIIGLTNADSIVSLGAEGTIVHEWAHSIHDRITYEARNIVAKRADELYEREIADGTSPRDALKKKNKFIKDTHTRYGLLGSIANDRAPSLASMLNEYSKKLLGKPLFDENDPNDPRGAVPKGRPLYDYSKYEEYGFASRREMEDHVLEQLLTMKEAGYQRGGLLHYATQYESNTPQFAQGKRAADAAAATSPDPYVRSPYGQGVWYERWPEAVTGVLLKAFRKRPYWVNDPMLRLVQNLFMERDQNGPLVEKHGITSLRRRKRGQGDEYVSSTEDISSKIVSTEVPVVPDEVRQADGHRARMTLFSASSSALRFDPDERSRLRLGRSNIGLETDERLYAFDEPITVSDFRSRQRVYSIGDHRFYDTGVPFGQALGFRRRTTLGYLAGRRYVNRMRPHDGDMVRAISSSQFGLFINDMPVYDVTTDDDRQMLRGLVSGRISKLPAPLKGRIEQALKDATHIHSAIVGAEPTKNDLYRTVNTDSNTFLAGLVVGERIPMPITAFSRNKPSGEEMVIRVEKGAKSIAVDDGQFLSQGTFEVVSIDDVDGQVTATLKHVEVYDPRHDAMRPVDRFADKPGAMRKMGTPFPRYSRSEQERMETDLARRRDADTLRSQQFQSLRSGGSSGLGIEIDREIQSLVDPEVAEATPRNRRAEAARAIIEAIRTKILGEMRQQIDKRLDVARNAMRDKYQDATPWKEDADIVRKYGSMDPSSVNGMFERIRETVITALAGNEEFGIRNSNDLLTVTRPASERQRAFARERIEQSAYLMMNSEQLRKILDTGLIEVYTGRGMNTELGGHVPILLSEQERQMLTNVVKMSEVVERAYLLNDGGQSIGVARGKVTVKPDIEGGKRGVNIEFLTRGRLGDESRLSMVVGGKVFHSDEGRDVQGGYFRRTITTNNGQLAVEHTNMNLSTMDNGLGAATVLNQHSWQWWRQMPGTRVVLSAAMDGPIVWPRHGFHPKEASARRMDFDESGVNFTTLIDAISHVLLRTSDDPKVRASARPRDALYDGLIQARVDTEGRIRQLPPSRQIMDRIFGRSDAPLDMPEIELSPADRALRERLALWLSFAIEDRFRTTEDRKATMVMLANMLDTSNMTDKQKDAWKSLFVEAYHGEYVLELDGIDNDPDYLPSFVITDDAQQAGKIERAEMIRRERSQGARQDMFVTGRIISSEGPSEQPTVSESESALSRLNTVFTLAQDSSNDIESTRVQVAREIAGYDALPRLMTQDETVEAVRAARNFGKTEIGPWSNAGDPKNKQVAVVGIPQNGRQSLDAGLITDSIREFLRGNRSGVWDEMDESFWGGYFTTTPGEYAGRFVDHDDPFAEPAQTKFGMLGVTEPWSRWTSREELSETVDTMDTIIQDVLPEELPIPTGQYEVYPHNIPELLSNVQVTVTPSRIKRPLYTIDYVGEQWVWALDGDTLDTYIEENHPDLNGEQKKDIKMMFSLIGDLRTMQNTRTDVVPLATSIMELLTVSDNDNNDARRRMLLGTILGYDVLDETQEGEIRSRIQVLNRGAVRMNDEAVSLSDISRISGMRATPANPKASLRSAGLSSTMYGDGAPSLLGIYLQSSPEPIRVSPSELRSQSYQRLIRQDFGIDVPTRSLRSKDRNLANQIKDYNLSRDSRRQGTYELPGADRNDYRRILDERVAEHSDLTEAIDEIDGQIDELESQYLDLDESNTLTDEMEKTLTEQIERLQDQKSELELKKNVIYDDIAKEVNSINKMLEVSMSRYGMARALRAFLDDEASVDIPEEYKDRVTSLLAELGAMNDVPEIEELKWRHKMLEELLDEDFDIRYGVTRDGGRDETAYEGAQLDDIDWDDIDEPADEWLEWVYRGFFDPNFEQWRDGRMDRMFDPWIERFKEMGIRSGDERSASRRIQDLFDSVVDGITRRQREEWSARHSEFLDDEFNAEYEESLIDATPASQTPRPNGVPEKVWRKIRAAAKLAMRTPYDGERRNANDLAKRLLEQHRPDLANDNYVSSLRSSGRLTHPTIKGVNLYSTGPVSRGALPERPRTPKLERPHALIAERLRFAGYDVKEEDLMPTGKYGKQLAEIFSNESAVEMNDLMKMIETADKGVNWTYPISDKPYPPEDVDVLKAIVLESAKVAAQSGWSLSVVDGHSVKKINGPIDTRIADVLADEEDIALLRSLGSPTYKMMVDVQAEYYKAVARLNKMFGAYESREEDGFVNRVGMELSAEDNSFGAFARFVSEQTPDEEQNIFRDIRGNVVMSVPIEPMFGSGRVSALLDLDRNRNRLNTNDAIVEAMFEAIGVDYSAVNGMDDRTSLSEMRKMLETRKRMADKIEFAPTPAGRHMRDLFASRIAEIEQVIDIHEKIGKRYVQLMKESGIKTSDLEATLKDMVAGKADRGKFSNGSATGDRPEVMSFYDQALYAFMRMTLGSPLLPRITDSDTVLAGTHEIGHFALGQGFTRHGEFVANLWPLAVYGPHMWRSFAGTQRLQSPTFDSMTLYGHFGRNWNADQQRTFSNLSKETKALLKSAYMVRLNERGTQMRNRDVNKMFEEVIAKIEADDELSDIEKSEIISSLSNQIDSGYTALSRKRVYKTSGRIGEEDTSEMQRKFEDAKNRDLTPEVMSMLGIVDPYDPNTDPDDLPVEVVTNFMYNELIPLDASLFGVPTKDGKQDTRQELVNLLAMARQMVGPEMMTFGDETQEQMEKMSKARASKSRATRRKISGIIEKLERLADSNEALSKEFSDEIKKLKAVK